MEDYEWSSHSCIAIQLVKDEFKQIYRVPLTGPSDFGQEIGLEPRLPSTLIHARVKKLRAVWE